MLLKLLAFLSALASIVFFAYLTLGDTLGDISLLPAGLLCLALAVGFFLLQPLVAGKKFGVVVR